MPDNPTYFPGIRGSRVGYDESHHFNLINAALFLAATKKNGNHELTRIDTNNQKDETTDFTD